jgi:hypothetical protein
MGAGTNGLQPSVSLLDHGSYVEMVVRWERRVQGAKVPDMREVRINPATGAVFAYANLSLSYSDPSSPTLTSDQASAIAQKAMAGPAMTIESTDLLAMVDSHRSQKLVWRVALISHGPVYPTYSCFYVNALDGSIVDVTHG